MTARFIAPYGTPAAPATFDRHYCMHSPITHRLPGCAATRPDGRRPSRWR
ncbi:hypothetical protein QF037_009045 [Streptomyces canus]|nr:hypothetical protein [Streptomyces canus]